MHILNLLNIQALFFPIFLFIFIAIGFFLDYFTRENLIKNGRG